MPRNSSFGMAEYTSFKLTELAISPYFSYELNGIDYK